jgi:hypothetical protein
MDLHGDGTAMSIDIRAQVRESRTLAEILLRAESYVATVPHPPFLVLTPWVSAAEFRIEPFVVPTYERDGRSYKDWWTSWDHDTIEIGAGPVSQIGLEMAYAARPNETDFPPELVESLGGDDDDRGYRAVFLAHRTRGSFCLTLLVAAAIADLNRARIQDDSNLLKLGEWVDPEAIVALFQRHRGVTSFEELIDVVTEEIWLAPTWPSARSMLAELQRPSH